MHRVAESAVLKQVLRLSRGAVRLFRNNVGVLRDERGRRVAYGLCRGSSDTIGWRTIVIRPEDVGRRVAVFVAIECKAEDGTLEPHQRLFLNAVADAGGIAGVARSATEAERLLFPLEWCQNRTDPTETAP